MSQNAWLELHYVADPETSLSNDDGLAQDLSVPGTWTPAFKIDKAGLNQPLLSESMSQDNVFESGEVWEFVIQDYVNPLTLNPSLLDSWDSINTRGEIAGASAGGPPSSGSIIAIPEPTSLGLICIAGVLAKLFRRRFRT